MSIMLKRCLHLVALLALGVLVFTGTRASAISGPFAVATCTTLAPNTSYFLTANINTSGTCFIVGENTALDMKNHTITGNNTGDGITDNGIAAPNVVIVNGTITHFDNGIDMFKGSGDSFNLTVDNVKANTNSEEGIASGSCCNTVTNTKAQFNGDDGIDFFSQGCCDTFSNVNASSNDGDGIFMSDCCTLASGITANSNGGDGIDMRDCCNAVVGSTTNQNDDDGIFMNSDDNFVESSTSNSNLGDGIFFGESCCGLVDHATAVGNHGNGITADDCCNLVSNSVASQNFFDGIDLSDDDDNIVLRDTTALNGIFGVEVECLANVVRLVSHNNFGTDLCEFGGNCTNVNNFAPVQGCL